MRAQAAYSERASLYRDAGLSDVWRAEAVSTTAAANVEKNSTIGADAMHAMLPLKKNSSPGRGCWEATTCVEQEGAAIAPVAAARDRRTLSSTRDASRAATFA